MYYVAAGLCFFTVLTILCRCLVDTWIEAIRGASYFVATVFILFIGVYFLYMGANT